MRQFKFEYGFDSHAPVRLTLTEIEQGLDFYTLGTVIYRRQFTGYYDVEGAEIYEGDIMYFEDIIWPEDSRILGYVKLSNEAYANTSAIQLVSFEGRPLDFYGASVDEYQGQKLKVVGNIHTNKELLEESL